MDPDMSTIQLWPEDSIPNLLKPSKKKLNAGRLADRI